MKKLAMISLCFLMTSGFSMNVNAKNQGPNTPQLITNSHSNEMKPDPRRYRRHPRRPGRRYRFPPRRYRYRFPPRYGYSFMTCRAGMRSYRGYISRIWYGRAWGPRSTFTYRRACQSAISACLRYNRYYYNTGGRCIVLGK